MIKVAEKFCGTKLGHNSKDGLWTLQEVECLGACANAPMLQINNKEVYEDLNEENLVQLLEDLKSGSEVRVGPQTAKRVNSEGPQGRTTLKLDEFDPFEGFKFDRDFEGAKQEWEDARAAKK